MRYHPPVSRSEDPLTSYEAEQKINESGARESIMRRALAAITESPGLSHGEIAERLGLEPHQVWRRVSDLKSKGLIHAGPKVQWKGNGQQVWYPGRAPDQQIRMEL